MASFANRRKFRGSSYKYPKNSPGTTQPITQPVESNDSTEQIKNARDRNPRMLRGHPPVMAYPSAKGMEEITGDSLLIKCFKYIPPKADLSFESENRITTKDGVWGGVNQEKNQIIVDEKNNPVNFVVPGSSKLTSNGSSDLLKKGSTPLFYVELPIPQDINDSNSVTWSDDNMNIFQLAGLEALNAVASGEVDFNDALSQVTAGFSDDFFGNAQTRKRIGAIIGGKAINQLGQNISANTALGRSTGTILNSNLELLFNGVNLRTFPFSINFSPRNADEAKMVKYIIRAFKSSMAAKKGTTSDSSGGNVTPNVGQGGVFLSAPDVFSLEYRHRNRTHPFLNSFKHCALTGMTVNYTQAGTYASYYDGTPVNIRMNLTFKELNPIYHEDYDFDENMRGVGY